MNLFLKNLLEGFSHFFTMNIYVDYDKRIIFEEEMKEKIEQLYLLKIQF